MSALAVRLREAEGRGELQELLVQLRADPRRSARQLCAVWLRKREAADVEQRRLHALHALRRALLRAGAQRVAGVDEVGMGPLAGPVVAAAVVLPDAVNLPGLNDSKRLTPAKRASLARAIREQALALAVAEIGPEEIDRLNIYRAGLLAMRRAVVQLSPPPDHVFVDARTLPELPCPQTALVHGDAREASIAAASVVAKVHRDTIMIEQERRFPGYGFDRHMGYGTEEHVAALRRLGPCALHRRSFAPVAQLERRWMCARTAAPQFGSNA